MLTGIAARETYGGLARSKARDYETRTVSHAQSQSLLDSGWTVDRRSKKSVRVRRPKPHAQLLEDRVWALFYRMQFAHLSGARGAQLKVDAENESPSSQIDVVAVDAEVVLAVECKSSESARKRPQFQEELAKLAQLRENFTKAARTQFPSEAKKTVVLAFFTNNVILSDNDRARAEAANVVLFDERDLGYYEALAFHLGPAAKYQLLAEMLPGKTIPGLTIRVPAVRTKMAGTSCYTFSINPEYLLKISYVSHRAKGKASDVNTYQRMLSKSRLSKIRDYILKDGIFPTNIVVNLEAKRLDFQRIHQESKGADQESGILGWLEIRPTYKCAWIIDGQHRLFGYSGLDVAAKSRLSVLAFEGLLPSKQAQLFIDINAKQKSVKQSLLQELYAELHWNSDEPAERVRAIVSKSVQELDSDRESPFYGRVQASDDSKDEIRCVTFTGLYSALKSDFYIAKEKGGMVVDYGPLWAGSNELTMKRTTAVVKFWFDAVRASAPEWWDKGSGEGGGLAMNDSVTACVNVLRSVFAHLENKCKLVQLDADDLCETVKPYANALGAYLGGLSDEERRRFRDMRGVQGQNRRTRLCQEFLRAKFSEFNPPGLDEYLEAEKAQTNLKSKVFVDSIERILHSVIVDELKRECGESESEWWIIGVPKEVRKKVTDRFEEDDGKRGSKEHYFDFIDYKKIAAQNWKLFEPVLAYGTAGGKDKKLAWLDFVNEKRKVVSHASSAVTLSISDLNQLQEYEEWLKRQVADSGSAKAGAAGA
jgi:DGQHR domain-containing protein